MHVFSYYAGVNGNFHEIQNNPQINRLEETWTTLRRNYTETAISYEKTLKPFYKNLYEGTGTDWD